MSKEVLLINDLAGYGKVALSAMIPVMSYMGIDVHNLPTALVSNTLDYGKFDILDTTEYMKNALHVWKELGFSFDAISTGFIVNSEQAELITDYCKEQSDKGVMILCDPIMGDDGSLYPGMGEETVLNMRKLISCADYILPNYTEAVFLTGRTYKERPDEEEIRSIIDSLREAGAGSVAVTSVVTDNVHKISCYDKKEDRYFDIPYENIPVRFPGTGDIFSSVMLGSLMNGERMEDSVAKAAQMVKTLIGSNLDAEDRFRGIEIERCLKEMEI